MGLFNRQKHNWFRRAFAALAIAFFVIGLTPLVNAKPAVVMFYGDSLTASYGLAPEQGYPALIQEKIETEGLQNEYAALASAVSGETSAGGLSRINWALAGLDRGKQELAVFVLALGANDGLRGLPTDAMAKNLQSIIDRVKEKHPEAQIVVAQMFMPPNLGEAYRESFAETYQNVAEANDAVMIPFLLKDVAGDPKLNLPDGIHPNAKGQQIMADNLWPILEPLLTTQSPQS